MSSSSTVDTHHMRICPHVTASFHYGKSRSGADVLMSQAFRSLCLVCPPYREALSKTRQKKRERNFRRLNPMGKKFYKTFWDIGLSFYKSSGILWNGLSHMRVFEEFYEEIESHISFVSHSHQIHVFLFFCVSHPMFTPLFAVFESFGISVEYLAVIRIYSRCT